MRVLCLAAHPDDETLGAGGTLLRHAADGDETFLAVATVAYEPRWPAEVIARKRAECLAAAADLGIRDVRFLGYRTMHLNALPAIELGDALARLIQELRPEVVYAPPLDDLNRDHAVLCEAAIVATRPEHGPAPRLLYSYEIPTTTRMNAAPRWQPNTYVDISRHIDGKLAAMSRYGTELRPPPHPRSLEAIRLFAQERGVAVGFAFGEAHMLLRALR
jgi:LmbE family N-acetylglucosaminyl deacetylase